MDKYRKAITSCIMATIIAIIPIVNAGPLTVVSEVNIGIAFASAVMVYFVPNVPEGYSIYVKTTVASVMAGLSFIVTVVTADCSSIWHIFGCVAFVNWLQVIVIVMKAAGVYFIPNEPENQ